MSKRTPAVYLYAVLVFAALSATAAFSQQPTLTPQTSNTTALLIAVSPVDENVVWAVGTNSIFVVTTDGGNTWRTGVVPTGNANDIQLRDVQAVSADVAYVLSIGNLPTDFAIYKTTDGGHTWTLQFQNQLVGAFYDCMAFWTATSGIAHSDSVNGVFPDLRTMDGMTWQSIANNMPPALPGEASFSSSGTCVATQGTTNAWIATGGSSIARILATTDGGNTWNAYDTPLHSSPSAGGFSVAFRDASNGILGGGDLAPANTYTAAQAAASHDGGQTWQLTQGPAVGYPIFGLAYLSNTTGVGGQRRQQPSRIMNRKGRAQHNPTDYTRYVVVTADLGGAAWTPDEGTTWNTLPGVTGYWAVAFANPQNGWMVGLNGQILKVSFP
ncbi:MAG: YCF48-related protein [Candidatus Korobacteraceae bacterium]